MAFILPRWIYSKNVGFDILRYCIAWSVVKTRSFSVTDIEFPPFVLICLGFMAKYVPSDNRKDLILSPINFDE
jgi:hypothetical protein